MFDRLERLVTLIAKYEALLDEYDNAMSNYFQFKYRKDLVEAFATTDELLNVVNDLDRQAIEFKKIWKGASEMFVNDLGRNPEELRLDLTEARTIMSTILSKVSEETANKLTSAHSLEDLIREAELRVQATKEG